MASKPKKDTVSETSAETTAAKPSKAKKATTTTEAPANSEKVASRTKKIKDPSESTPAVSSSPKTKVKAKDSKEPTTTEPTTKTKKTKAAEVEVKDSKTKKFKAPLQDELEDDIEIDEEELLEAATEVIVPVIAPKTKAKKIEKIEVEEYDEDALISTRVPTVIDEALLLPIKEPAHQITDIITSRKYAKHSFIYEINEAEERLNKKKYTEIKPLETLTKAIRTSDRRGEETQEEMEARIARLLQEDDRSSFDPDRVQMCTKCGEVPVYEGFVIDRNLGFCEECANLLRLGETKEAKTFEFGLGHQDEPAAPEEDDAAY